MTNINYEQILNDVKTSLKSRIEIVRDQLTDLRMENIMDEVTYTISEIYEEEIHNLEKLLHNINYDMGKD